MSYGYHVQKTAEKLANSMFPVPVDYPVKNGLPWDYPKHFSYFHKLMKSIHFDMAKQPEAYGLKLVDMESKDKDLIRKGSNSIHRLFDTLYCLAACGIVENHQLKVSADRFKAAIKKPQSVGSAAVSKYELVLSRLVDFGFSISDFNGKAFGKDIEHFVVEYPAYPQLADTIKQFYDCWIDLFAEIRASNSQVRVRPTEYHHRAYIFDYKVTANLENITVKQWLSDEAKYHGTSDADNAFLTAFYNYSLNYEGLTFNGDYYKKTKRIVRDMRGDSSYNRCAIQIYLKNMGKYAKEIASMPQKIQRMFATDYCFDCHETCRTRFSWEYDDTTYRGCGHYCFEIVKASTSPHSSKLQDGFDMDLIPYYWRLLELEYGLHKIL